MIAPAAIPVVPRVEDRTPFFALACPQTGQPLMRVEIGDDSPCDIARYLHERMVAPLFIFYSNQGVLVVLAGGIAESRSDEFEPAGGISPRLCAQHKARGRVPILSRRLKSESTDTVPPRVCP